MSSRVAPWLRRAQIVTSSLVLCVLIAGVPARVAGAAALQLDVRGVAIWTDSVGFWHVTGDVVNATSSRADLPEIDATYYNSSGQVVGTGLTFPNAASVAVGGSSSFEILETSEPAGFDHLSLTATAAANGVEPSGGFTIVPGVPYTDGLGDRHFPGELRNASTYSLQYPEVFVSLYASDGSVIATSLDFTAALAPGGTGSFDILVTDHFAAYSRYTLQAYGDASSSSVFVTSWDNYFDDVAGNLFRNDIIWLANSGITAGCAAGMYCPDAYVTRGQMAAFLDRALSLPATTTDYFTDDEGSIFETDINRLAASGITSGCTPTTFCPDAYITRGQMAAFLDRALSLPATTTDYFTDDEGSIFETDINRLAASGITSGCTPTTFCPDAYVTRGQMAAFLHRAVG